MEYTIMISRIEELCQKRGINKTTAFVQSGVGKDFSSNLKKGNVPSSDKISLLADYLNCSTDYLLGRTTAPEQPMQFQTTKEQQILLAYKAHPELQPAIDKLLGIEEETVIVKEIARTKTMSRTVSETPVKEVRVPKSKIQAALEDKSIKTDDDL